MNFQEAQSLWENQGSPIGKDQIARTVESFVDRQRQQVHVNLFFTVACLLVGCLNFYGQFVGNGDPLLIAALRFSLVIAVLPIQLYVWWSSHRTHQHRSKSNLDQRAWLRLMVEDLKGQVHQPNYWLLLYSVGVIGVMSFIKWLEYQRGIDTAAEGVGIVAVVACFMAFVYVGVKIHQRNVLKPRLERYESMLASVSEA